MLSSGGAFFATKEPYTSTGFREAEYPGELRGSVALPEPPIEKFTKETFFAPLEAGRFHFPRMTHNFMKLYVRTNRQNPPGFFPDWDNVEFK